MSMQSDPVVVARFYYRHQAEFAKAYLDAAGIESAIFADDAGGAEVALSFSNSVRLLVHPENFDKARAVLAAEGQDDSQEPNRRMELATTKDIVLGFLGRVKAKEGWEDLLSDDLQFTNYTDPVRSTTGKHTSLEGIRRFYAMVSAMDIKRIIVEGQQACALMRYELQPPVGPSFESNIAEVFDVRDGKISSFGIYFDSAPYPKSGPAG